MSSAPAFAAALPVARSRIHGQSLQPRAGQITARPRRRSAWRPGSPRMDWKPAGLLKDAVLFKQKEVEALEEQLLDRPDHPINMRRSFFASKPTHHLSKALRRRDGTLAVVASIKRFQAPIPGSRAEVVACLDNPPADVRAYHAHGADAAMFYTDSLRYGCELSELRATARGMTTSSSDGTSMGRTTLPLIQHDVIVDPVQIAEAVDAGACAVNLVASAVLPDIMELMNAATAMGVESVVECHTKLEVQFAMECGATILFLNNWDRTRNMLEPGTAEKLIEEVPPFVLTIGGGGLQTSGDCWSLLDAGFNGVVLGETLLKSRRPKEFIEEIRTQKRFTGDVFSGDFGGAPFSQGTNVDL